MKNSINNLLFLALIILTTIISCVPERNDIYKIIPKNSFLTLNIIKQSKGIYKTNNGIVLLYELKDKELYSLGNYHLLFYNKNKRLISACYFFSENIYYYKNNSITAYLNTHRIQRKGGFRDDIPADINIKYKNYKNEFPHGCSFENGDIKEINFDKQEGTINFTTKNSVNQINKLDNIPLFKLTFNYETGVISINNTLNDETRETIDFKIRQQQLDDFFRLIIK